MAQAQPSRRILEAAKVPNANEKSKSNSESNGSHSGEHSGKRGNGIFRNAIGNAIGKFKRKDSHSHIGNKHNYIQKLKDQFQAEIADLEKKFNADIDECAADRELCAVAKDELVEKTNLQIAELEKHMEKLEENTGQLHTELKRLHTKYAECDDERHSLQKAIAELKDRQQKCRRENDQCLANQEKLQQEINHLSGQLEGVQFSKKVAALEEIICRERMQHRDHMDTEHSASTSTSPTPVRRRLKALGSEITVDCSAAAKALRRRLQSDSVGAVYAADQIVCDALAAQDVADAGAIDLDVALNLNACVMGSQYVVVDSVLHLQTFSDALCQAELTQFSTCAQFHLQ